MNRKLTRNTDLNYYKEYPTKGNCGSFALRIEEWYEPDDSLKVWNYDYAIELLTKGANRKTILDKLLKRSLVGIKNDFGDSIVFLNKLSDYKEKKDEELIAFRVGFEQYKNYTDTDFHFRVFRDGRWQEKCGAKEVIDNISLEEDRPWNSYGQIYDSEIAYFVHKLGD